MHFIVFDLELNQDFSSLQNQYKIRSSAPLEIIQIGAVKLDSAFNTVDTFNRYIKPTIYTRINPFVTELTGITIEELESEEQFPEVYMDYIKFIDSTDSIFGIWGTSDIKELFRNVEIHNLSSKMLPRRYINIQPYVSMHFNLSPKKQLRLQHAVEALNLPIKDTFHDAFYDAYYTAEIFKKIYNSFMQPKIYDPTSITIKQRPPKRQLDQEGLLNQFEKMYARKMTKEEQDIILLAYKMGKTNQFLK